MCWQSSDSYFPESIFTSVLSLDKIIFIQIMLYDCFLLIFECYVLSSKKHFLSEKRPSESAFSGKITFRPNNFKLELKCDFRRVCD